MFEIVHIDTTDLAALERHVEFERAHGLPRYEAPALRVWCSEVDTVTIFAAHQPVDGVMTQVGSAIAARMAMFGDGAVFLNMHAAEGRTDVLAAMASAAERWEGAAGASELFGQLYGASSANERDWEAIGFAAAGTRSRLVRAVTGADAQLVVPAIDGVTILSLAERPELELGALALWNAGQGDIPSAIPFVEMTREEWRRDMGVGLNDDLPASFFVAVSDDDAVVGLAYLAMIDAAEGIAGHRFTAVDRLWRGRGVARALKVTSLRWAAEHGVRQVRASNDSDNVAMRAINDALGYELAFPISMYRRAIAPVR